MRLTQGEGSAQMEISQLPFGRFLQATSQTEQCTGPFTSGQCCSSCPASHPYCSIDCHYPGQCAAGCSKCQCTCAGEACCYGGMDTIPCPAPPASSECSDTCNYASDHDCDDGGPGAEYTACAFGADCTDCGARQPRPSPPSPPAPPPSCFEVGIRVRLIPGSRYSSQSTACGTVSNG